VTKLLQIVATIALVLACFILVVEHHGAGLLILAGIAVVSVATLVSVSRRQKRRASALPPELARLAYRSEPATVTFIWQWRGRRSSRDGDREQSLRILRSEAHGAATADEGSPEGQVCVYEGSGDLCVDDGVAAGKTYHYSLFVRHAGGAWSAPVLVQAMTRSALDRASLERHYSGTRTVSHQYGGGPGKMMAELRLADAVSGVATDAILSVIDVFARHKPGDGWEEIA